MFEFYIYYRYRQNLTSYLSRWHAQIMNGSLKKQAMSCWIMWYLCVT